MNELGRIVTNGVTILEVNPLTDRDDFRDGEGYREAHLLPGSYELSTRLDFSKQTHSEKEETEPSDLSLGEDAMAVGLAAILFPLLIWVQPRNGRTEHGICEGRKITLDVAAGEDYLIDGLAIDGDCYLWIVQESMGEVVAGAKPTEEAPPR